jgi:hypothetical protein
LSYRYLVLVAAMPAGLASTGVIAATFEQPYPCAIQSSGDSGDCASFGLGNGVNGCLKVDGIVVNGSAKSLDSMIVTVLVDGKVVANINSHALAGPIAAGQKGPYSGSAKFEVSQAVALTTVLYAKPKVECLISTK